ncbi:MAG TPA: VanZ family protein [Candidatus Kaiserbacteria bacterium]|nr:VanZ family protein [Candidatus Kaiserbacteria bacterium]
MKHTRIIAIILFIAYLAFLLKIIVFKYPLGMVFEFTEGNFVPFKTILMYLSGHPTWIVAKNNLVGNIALFVPLGLFLPFLSKHSLRFRTVTSIALAVGIAMESIQILFRTGVFDVDDIILNALGVVVGYGIFIYVKKWRK